MTNTVIAKAETSDRKLSALLVQRHIATQGHDEFFLIVTPTDQREIDAISTRELGDSAALVATLAQKVQLLWQSDNELLVICDSCGLEAIDIEKKLDHAGSTKITYQGFPAHIANE